MAQRATAAGLSRHAEAQAGAVERWARVANRLIAGKVEDAAAHAIRATTETLRRAPDGRKTVAGVRRSRSYDAAIARLGELADGVVLAVQEARGEFLGLSWSFWGPVLGDDRGGPPDRLVAATRGAALHGYTLSQEVRYRTDAVGRALQAAIAQAAGQEVGSRLGATILRTWETRSARSVLAATKILLSDSAVLADQVAAWYLIPPDERPEVGAPVDA